MFSQALLTVQYICVKAHVRPIFFLARSLANSSMTVCLTGKNRVYSREEICHFSIRCLNDTITERIDPFKLHCASVVRMPRDHLALIIFLRWTRRLTMALLFTSTLIHEEAHGFSMHILKTGSYGRPRHVI